jgi:hypothetical protein
MISHSIAPFVVDVMATIRLQRDGAHSLPRGQALWRIRTFRLTPGKYVLIRNLAGHYHAGIHAAFRAT